MKLFVIRDESLPDDAIVGYLVYYENQKAFYIELPDNADRWIEPPILSEHAMRGIPSVDSYWSHRWVQNRIVPQDRQNIGQILRDNGLAEYDEMALLILANGRCAQDDCYLEEIPVNALPEFIHRRWQTKVVDVAPLEVPQVLVFFQNGNAKLVNLQELSVTAIEPHLRTQERFNAVEVQPGGYGIFWNSTAAISYADLYDHGTTIPISLSDLYRYIQHRVVCASEACSMLNCSRQNIDDLMRRDKLHPIRVDAKYKLFPKAEVMQRKRTSN